MEILRVYTVRAETTYTESFITFLPCITLLAVLRSVSVGPIPHCCEAPGNPGRAPHRHALSLKYPCSISCFVCRNPPHRQINVMPARWMLFHRDSHCPLRQASQRGAEPERLFGPRLIPGQTPHQRALWQSQAPFQAHGNSCEQFIIAIYFVTSYRAPVLS